MLLGDQGTLEKIKPFLHGIEFLTQLPNCGIGKRAGWWAGLKALGECTRNAHDDYADGDDSDNQDDGQGVVHRSGFRLSYKSCCGLTGCA